ncbi:hypothetical protein BpHYR1_010996 [Brachionus plicatilis]|uniref:Uncharacterized protein n=1 Tax=Brachionus plicatilis TaxID=10195 RepID=A0A3M7PDJ7_BRAPC|nr:hypothetical protein BpHYR1_010996 [Brachionus plicatilis]
MFIGIQPYTNKFNNNKVKNNYLLNSDLFAWTLKIGSIVTVAKVRVESKTGRAVSSEQNTIT